MTSFTDMLAKKFKKKKKKINFLFRSRNYFINPVYYTSFSDKCGFFMCDLLVGITYMWGKCIISPFIWLNLKAFIMSSTL